MTHALISSEPIQVATPRFCRDPWVLKYFDIYTSKDDLLIEHGSIDGNNNLASPLSLFSHLLVIILDLLASPIVRQILISYHYFIIIFYYAQLPQQHSIF